MREQKLIEKIESQAKIFKLRGNKGHDDDKRHDIIQRDEQKWMWTARNKLDWSYAKIGSTFGRDHRTTRKAVESYENVKRVAKQKPHAVADPFASKLYQEHQSDMLHLVERLSAELESPLSLLRLRSLKGRGTNSNNSLGWQVEDGKSVCLYYGLELAKDPKTKILRGYLDQHLHSSSYHWLIDAEEKGIKKWTRLGGEDLKMRTILFHQMNQEVEKLPDPNPIKNLPWGTETFSDSLLEAALEGRTFYYTVAPVVRWPDDAINIDLTRIFKVQYGAIEIGLTTSEAEGAQYVEWHKQLMDKYKEDPTVKAINQLKTERELVIKDIQEVFIKFVVDKYIPGKCNYEFCRYG